MINTGPIYSSKTDRMDITIDIPNSTIFIQQKWKYDWKNLPKTSAWTYTEKKAFHNQADRLLWQQWSSHFILNCTGTSNIAKNYNTSNFKVNFDIKWVLTGEHWNVNVKKIKKGTFSSSSVSWNSRVINLDTEDLIYTEKRTNIYQFPLSHEFGHAIGNSKYAAKGMHADEYKASSKFNLDYTSRMNAGSELRERHIDFILLNLNKMIPNTTFIINSFK
ncbi:hypothetical protein [Lacinutrix mariniflava]|uniref:hypothetical protein n=1 Tax=Lacinutrix mariniflava TaxID=342955 RepID=UPI0006E158CC|nr:hypothetical protein [Lacinutrix mariniflava]